MTARRSSLFLVATGICIAIAAHAQQAQQPRQQEQSGRSDQGGQNARQADDQIDHLLTQIAQDPKTAADKLFILTAALHNQSEIQLAREVLQKSQNPQVKKMAQDLINNLQKTHDEIQRTAQSVGLQLPQDLGRAAVQEVQIVAALPADQIDRQYTSQVQADNAQDMSQYQSEAQIAQDPQVKQFAQQQVQGVQQRSRDADRTAQAMGMNNPGEAQPAGGNIQGKRDQNR